MSHSPSLLDDDLAYLSPQLPRLWVGYAWAGILFLIEIVAAVQNPNAPENSPAMQLLVIGNIVGVFYWLYCVYKYHDIMTQVPDWNHPIGVGRAVGFHFIPFYNFYWIYKWPTEIARFANWRSQSRLMSPLAAGTLMLAAFLVRFFDTAIGLALIFAAGSYISNRLRKSFAAPPPPMPPAEPKFQLGL